MDVQADGGERQRDHDGRLPALVARAETGVVTVMAAAAAVVVLSVAPAKARADADEASVAGLLVGGLAHTVDHGAAATSPLLGGALRMTLARSDRWAFETALAGFESHFRHVDATELLGGLPGAAVAVHGVVLR
jgi:hypothetical protein